MSRHCSSVKSVGYDLSFIAPLPQNLTPTRRVNNSPDQMSRDNNCPKFSKPCNGHALRISHEAIAIGWLRSTETTCLEFARGQPAWTQRRRWTGVAHVMAKCKEQV